MKKILSSCLILAACLACTPKASKGTAATTPVGPTVAEAPGAAHAPTDAHLTAVKTKHPDATMDQLKQGHGLYFGACTRCHTAQDPKRWDETQWKGILDEMATKAEITAPEKDAVWKYVMAIKLAAK